MPPAFDHYDSSRTHFSALIQAIQQNNAAQFIGVAFAISAVSFTTFISAKSLTAWIWPSSLGEDAQVFHELGNFHDARRAPALAVPDPIFCQNHTSLRKIGQGAFVTHERDGRKLEHSEAAEATAMSQISYIAAHEVEEEALASDEDTDGDSLEQANEIARTGGPPYQDDLLREWFGNANEQSSMILELGAWANEFVDIDGAVTDVKHGSLILEI